MALVCYADAGSEVYKALTDVARAHPFVEVCQRNDMKWPNFRHWVEKNGGAAAVVARYDYVWVVDDDIQLSTRQINELFSVLRKHDEIQFASPSYDAQSDGVWRYFDVHDPQYSLRYTDFVECAASVMKASMLLDPVFLRCLSATRTGCFLDFCFHAVSGGCRKSVAIVDAVQCHHPPRDASTPSEMRSLIPWEDHKKDAVHFEEAGIPKDWWWYRKPQVFAGEPAESE
eukprot:CAMPEP_0179328292 /NCGR_PEP_ID=MMETSP0797-20121207/62439_1 /TAXON_ID=47934 /ORGANISM="Dinophysis acuminata, Strain DAEP01" /LENGTH=228 /DNA_ID=CAMNT_0021040717 /DNA_START=99 /DNA_END=782 /DNA_ORIENTATION=-